ncbi:MAG TPA: hypothetical protein VE081_01715 [Sporichthyaceae bacterium]|nr:hypothetical protein [Sporichthyaceae bacterium]
MRKSRRTAVLAIAAVGALLPAGTASAVSTGDAPAKHRVVSKWGHIKICKHGLDTFDVYADGQGKTWQSSLNDGRTDCTNWGAMRPGQYDIAFAQNVASQQHVVIFATYRDNKGKMCRKAFTGQGVLNSLLLPGKSIKINLLLHRS